MQSDKLIAMSGMALIFVINTAYADALHEKARTLFKPIPKSVAEFQGSPILPEQIVLGKKLFFEPRISKSHVISCNTCHNVGTGGADNVPVSIGHNWQKGGRNSPTVFNSVFNASQFWDGRAKNLEEQAKGPVQNPVEMHNTPKNVELTLNSIPEYVGAFQNAFPEEKKPVSFDNMARAIQAFETTLITPNSRFDQYLEGNEKALNEQEKKGLRVFMDAGCSACHNGVNLGGQAYFRFGLVKQPNERIMPRDDKGRFAITKAQDDEYVFRTAPLRNVALTAPYFHSGQVWDLKEAVVTMGETQIGVQLVSEEVDAIVAFLGTLTGQQPKIKYPTLPASTSDTPRPNN
ncbi:TPA: cytochrome-c peroxidase [Pseudomonas aeruginosa]